ncbi:IclR family transcriptional regulator [Peptoniphilus sp. AGMB00490]|uniref:IclR family transcriptional regulator n=2 Tax=Peptoniphilus TaxID=162289 RepID=A0ACD6AZM0_9FIRM|nr:MULTISPECIES: IclR family transcriptional regulator [Peptoniphilus]NMW84431.1 IclR family transcriptional regulator [Peptoniphilus faecalis]OLR65006.1 transcriptional regulator [Peptoniphilus porci]
MIQSLVKAANVLDVLKNENRELTIAEISEILNIPPSTAHRILSTLIEIGYVSKDERTHLYGLGPSLIPLGIKASSKLDPQDVGKSVLENLSEITMEDSFFVIKSGDKGLMLSKSEGKHTLKIVENFGIEIDLHKGAIRKTILAFQPDDYINYYLKKDLSNYLDSPVDKEELRKDLMEIRSKKISVSDSEYIEGAIGIGAPVFNYKDVLVGAIGVVIPKERVTEETKREYIEAVKNCGIEFSKNLGHSEV